MWTPKPLNDKRIAAAAPRQKEYSLWDGQGLHIIIKPSGKKAWRLQFSFDGKKKLMGLGEYPAVGLKAAREKAHRLRGLIAANINPIEQRREEKVIREREKQRAHRTFRVVGDEWFTGVTANYRASNQKKVLWLLRLLYETLGDMPIEAIRYADIRLALREVAEKGNVVTAHKMGGKAREICGYARRNGYIDSNPADDFTKDLPSILCVWHRISARRGPVRPSSARQTGRRPRDATALYRLLSA
ncbi:MAG: integrase arm-type DNA-binding domain-containing protein [Desulfobulbaceae bacterium]|nr:integrase arm-type DNA-binding domain-containing protein [Desulfobulbaceae bacterium]